MKPTKNPTNFSGGSVKRIPDNSVDLVVTDPPYVHNKAKGAGAFGSKTRTYHNGVRELSDGFRDEILDEMKRVLKKMNLYIFCSKEQIIQIMRWIEKNDYKFDLLTYHKINPVPTCHGKYLSDTEYIFFIKESGVKVGGNYHTKRKYFVMDNSKSEYDHSTVKPKKIIRNFIFNSSEKGDIVLDLFIGTGTTGVVAKEMDRKFIGFEINEEYYKLGLERLSQGTVWEY